MTMLVFLATARTSGIADKVKLTLKARPAMAFSPAHIVVTADLTGGPNDNPDFYCASTEWQWGDDTKTEEQSDCDPYEAGKSEITRHFTKDHTYNLEWPRGIGDIPPYQDMHILLRLRTSGKVVASAETIVKIKPRPGEFAIKAP